MPKVSSLRSLSAAAAAICLIVPGCDLGPKIDVSPHHLVFIEQPVSAQVDQPIGTVSVAFFTESGVISGIAGDTITISLVTSDASAFLLGTLSDNAINGVVTFTDLTVNKAGTGFRILAKSTGFADVQSNTFDITP